VADDKWWIFNVNVYSFTSVTILEEKVLWHNGCWMNNSWTQVRIYCS